MAYDVTKTNGERLVIVPDRQVDTTTSIRLLGKNYPSYGEIMAENLVSMLEHFSNPTPPANPIIGQLWYKSTEDVLYVNATGATNGWFPIGGKEIIGGWNTGFHTASIKDVNGQYHPAMKIRVNGVNVAIVSSDAASYVPHSDTGLQATFPTIGQGINLNYSAEYDNFKLRGRAIEAEFADMAEIYIADGNLVPGNIVKLGGAKEITKTTSEFDPQVFGVISTAPGMLLNSRQKLAENAYPVALKGRVPCLVKGPVVKGQRIVSSNIDGVGMATWDFDAATIIGRAIGEKQGDDIGEVEVAVGVR